MFAQALRRLPPSTAILPFAAVNAGVGLAVANGRLAIAALITLAPVMLLLVGAVVASGAGILVFVGFALDLSGFNELRYPLGLFGSFGISVPDLVVLLAFGSWLGRLLLAPPDQRPTWPQTPVLGWPLAIFAAFLGIGIIRGHEAYGTAIFGQPLRFVLYAGIAGAVAALTPREAYKGIVLVFYAGAVWKAFHALVYTASGVALTDAPARLSTGGLRLVSLTAGLYLVGALVLALLNLELEQRAGRRVLHFVIALIALFGIVVSYGRGVYFATAVLVGALMISRRGLRSAGIRLLPLIAVLSALVALALPRAAPDLVPTFVDRVAASHLDDPSVRTRQEYYSVILDQVRENPLFGVGFGRSDVVSFDLFSRWYITQDAHNSYLLLLAGGGAMTLAAFIVLLLAYLKDAVGRFRTSRGVERALIVWAVATWFAFAVNTLVEPQLTQPASLLAFWLLLLLPSVVARGGFAEQ